MLSLATRGIQSQTKVYGLGLATRGMVEVGFLSVLTDYDLTGQADLTNLVSGGANLTNSIQGRAVLTSSVSGKAALTVSVTGKNDETFNITGQA